MTSLILFALIIYIYIYIIKKTKTEIKTKTNIITKNIKIKIFENFIIKIINVFYLPLLQIQHNHGNMLLYHNEHLEHTIGRFH